MTESQMTDVARVFIEDSRAFFANYVQKIEHCLEKLTDEDVWWRPNEESNSNTHGTFP